MIGIDASRAFALQPTGTETYSFQVIRALLGLASHSFRLYFRTPPPDDLFPGAEIRVIPFPRLWTHVRLSWEMALRPPDLLFVPAHVLPPVHPPRSLVTVHDLGYRYFPRTHTRFQRVYLDLTTRWNARAAAHILADSETTRSDLTAFYGIPLEKVTVAHPGYDPSLAPVRDPEVLAAVRARYGIPGDYFLYLGTLQPRKNLHRLVMAFARLSTRSVLVLAGRQGWLSESLFAWVRRLGLEKRVLFPGYIPAEDRAPLLSGARAFVFPSLYEGFGLPVLEAQACGCPVICSSTSSLPEVAGDGALLVPPDDVAALADAMARLEADPDLRRELIERGLANLRRFSWERCARTVLQVMDTLLEGP
ncbi:MAG: glycosyltransferase family 1 protein [Anaerolineae bacterium]|nr:glycosyltransferase family 4 protein [Anaerolineae bacterium]MDW8069070.1 glycosyltransferase family 1 protein [Anaerolineae bacterium]